MGSIEEWAGRRKILKSFYIDKKYFNSE